MNEQAKVDEVRMIGKTPAGTKVEVVGKHIAANGVLIMYDVIRLNGDVNEKLQILPSDFIPNE